MNILNDMIMLTVDDEQKESFVMGSNKFFIVPNRHKYNANGRDTNPVLAKVHLPGKNTPFMRGDIIVTVHNTLMNGAMRLGKYCITPYDRWILAIVTNKGELKPTAAHVICERINMPSDEDFIVPESAQKQYTDRVKVIAGYGGNYEPGDVIGILKYADYEVVYNWNGEERRRVVVFKQDVICKF